MASIEEIRKERLKKIEILREKGIEPYPAKCEINHTVGQVLVDFDKLEESKKEITVGGRIMALRVQGGLAFFDLNDGI